MSALHATKRSVSEYSLALHERGWVANHDGNVSARHGRDGAFFITPTGLSKRSCPPESIVACDAHGHPTGRGRPPSEVAMHVGAYRHSDIGAVIHSHSPEASAFSLAGTPLGPMGMPEVVVSLGPEIPLVPIFAPKDPDVADAVFAALGRADVVLLEGNGVLSVGRDLEEAYLRAELIEHYAGIVRRSQPLGGPRALPDALMSRLLELRQKAGLGPRDGHAPRASAAATRIKDLRPIVAEEVRRALGGNS